MGGERREVPLLLPEEVIDPFAPPVATEAARRLYEETSPSVVQVHSYRGKDAIGPISGTGSGYFADNEGRVITDAHVVNGSKELWVTAKDGKEYRARIEKMDDIQDLAVLKLEGVKPGAYKPLESGNSQTLIPESPLYALGHPGGSRRTWLSPGMFQGNSTPYDELAKRGNAEEVFQELEMARRLAKPEEFADFEKNMKAPILSGYMRLEGGNSGGPIVDATGKVVGVAREILQQDHSQSFYSPVESANALLRNPRTKFSFDYAYKAEPWAEGYKSSWKESPVLAVGTTALAGGAGYLGLAGVNKYKLMGGMAAGYAGLSLIDDYGLFKTSTNTRDSIKHGVASLADVAMLGGSIATFIPKAKTVGLIALGVGAGIKVAADFIPNNLEMTGTRRDDGSLRGPFNRDAFIHEQASKVPRGGNNYYHKGWTPKGN